MKGKRLLRNDPVVFQVCVLGLPLQGLNLDSESSASHDELDCLFRLPHRVTRATL
jgi:hypothetical protein